MHFFSGIDEARASIVEASGMEVVIVSVILDSSIETVTPLVIVAALLELVTITFVVPVTENEMSVPRESGLCHGAASGFHHHPRLQESCL